MDFSFTAEQTQLRRSIIEFAERELGDAAESDRAARLNRDAWKKCAEFGITGWPVPKAYGGAGLDPVTIAVGLEALGYGCRDNGLVFALNNHLWACTVYLVEHGTEEQKARFLPGLADGSLIGAHALTEPESGSDVLGMKTTAERHGDTYVLRGTKTFISNAPVADVFLTFARTGSEDSPAAGALSAFVVTADLPGFRVSRSWEKAGLRSTEMGQVEFDECRVPAANLLGAEGNGFNLFTSSIDWERSVLFASQIGVMERVLDDCVEHVRRRRQFGKPLGAQQAVRHRIADMKVRLELARLAMYKAAWRKREGHLAPLDAAIAKLAISESHLRSMLDAVQLHGARGYLTEFGVERELRDALAGTIYGGTSEIQRDIVAGLLGVPSS
ncbi:acyl-CoA dehydrogenase family protein [Saccharomonospora glauca]|uniref:Acyl-CoA dehydrogenase n=1 Tax=Saccharomonospora glauca K62 TaxID=928724 RepID=I1D2E6_9PSEU|nr:acyl-CoA dehydrogenase family protein [Saccharomonospora glauca]EIE99120.1 acyl-CoA dehydrogenase [Saccharomonospora glauca K62]